MYRLEYLPVAQKDMIEIVKYISEELQNPDAANHLATELIHAAESVITFPYAPPVYQPLRPLRHEYRKILVKNFTNIFFIIIICYTYIIIKNNNRTCSIC